MWGIETRLAEPIRRRIELYHPMSSSTTEKIDDLALSVERLIARNEATLGDYNRQEVSVPEYSSDSEAKQSEAGQVFR